MPRRHAARTPSASMSGIPAISASTYATGGHVAGRVAPVEAAAVCPPRRICCDHYCRVDRMEAAAGFIPYSDYIAAQNARAAIEQPSEAGPAEPAEPRDRSHDLPRIGDVPPPDATRDVQVYKHITTIERTMPSGSLLDVMI